MKIIYNSKLARLLLPNFKAILLTLWLLCKKGPEYYSEKFIKHEETHSFQWKCCMFLGVFIWLAFSLAFDTLWLLLLIPFTFYIWYCIEYVIRFIIGVVKTPPIMKFGFKKWFKGFQEIGHESYRKIVFEQEANAVEDGIVNYEFLSFFKYY